ncbi:sigma-70 family RNA polymerase sigma factor [Micromonospora echinofusca]|uniref:RNA polymerase sigma factor n=2 Tax=Micromonospora echinofusca TaxID=47858 RepID=A0ABS3VR62_MICEH|nr:sigma-70 family RNA polymerase sigma factor [Micromonospora echinofusca]
MRGGYETIAPQHDSETDEWMTELYVAHAEALRRFLRRLTLGDLQAAEDLLQETLLRAWRHLDQLPTDVASLRPWLFTVARRLAIDAARTRQVRPTEVGSVDLTWFAADDNGIDQVLAAETIRAALARLTEEHRRVLLEVYIQERSTREAAAILGIPEGTVKSRTHQALRALRAKVRC